MSWPHLALPKPTCPEQHCPNEGNPCLLYVENHGIHKAAKVKWDGSRLTVRLRPSLAPHHFTMNFLSPKGFPNKHSLAPQGSCPWSFVLYKMRHTATFPKGERQSQFDKFLGTMRISFRFITLVRRLQKRSLRLWCLTHCQPQP